MSRRMAGRRYRTVKLKLRITQQFDPKLERLYQRINALVEDPADLHKVIRQAAAETLLAAYRRRFLNRLADMVRTERAEKASSGPFGSESDVVNARKRLERASQKLTDAQLSDSGDAVQEAMDSVRKAERALVKALGGGSAQPRSDLATGKYRELALQVLRLVADASAMAEQSSGDGGMKLGIGHLATLERIRTPSATPMIAQHPTSSRMSTFWKHLEFGTGVYASRRTKRANAGSRFRDRATGGWWYGPRAGSGILLKGSRPGHFLFSAAGVAYDEDALRFEAALEKRLRELFES